MQIPPVRVPIDVEPARVFGCWAPLQHIEPPRVIGAADANMVGYEIEHLPETAVAERRHHGTERRFVAELWVELAMVYNIVPMSASRPRFEVRRGVDVADAEPRQIVSESCGIPEPEPLMELQAVRRPRDRRCTRFRHVRSFRQELVHRAGSGKSPQCR